uniref:PiggyBac transposable element-derived protein domain-containing protein n=1 Tax=Graphocephala atropunctata TaxID=36148 RepID=A0A1B6ML80_9HEMI
MVGKWKDVRDVLYISNQYENVLNVAVNRWGNEKMKPLPIIEYNNNMSGIDRKDQLMSYYPCERKTMRWHKKLLVHILQMGLLNAFILYNKFVIGRKKTMLEFRLDVVKTLLGPSRDERRVERDEEEEENEGEVKHLPTKVALNDKGIRARKKCKLCSRNGVRKDTTFECRACPDRPALCLQQCFAEYHA